MTCWFNISSTAVTSSDGLTPTGAAVVVNACVPLNKGTCLSFGWDAKGCDTMSISDEPGWQAFKICTPGFFLSVCHKRCTHFYIRKWKTILTDTHRHNWTGKNAETIVIVVEPIIFQRWTLTEQMTFCVIAYSPCHQLPSQYVAVKADFLLLCSRTAYCIIVFLHHISIMC